MGIPPFGYFHVMGIPTFAQYPVEQASSDFELENDCSIIPPEIRNQLSESSIISGLMSHIILNNKIERVII